jgi:hypothetical protein
MESPKECGEGKKVVWDSPEEPRFKEVEDEGKEEWPWMDKKT